MAAAWATCRKQSEKIATCRNAMSARDSREGIVDSACSARRRDVEFPGRHGSRLTESIFVFDS